MRIPNRKEIRKAYLRIIRHPGSPRRTGRGIAIGLFVAFLIPFTFHMLLALLLAFLLRGAKFAAACATWIINPLTIPLIYPLQCYVGGFLVGRPVSYQVVSHLVADVAREPSWNTFSAIGKGLLVPFFAGGLLFGGMAAIAGYHVSIFLVTRFRKRKAARKNRTSVQPNLSENETSLGSNQ